MEDLKFNIRYGVDVVVTVVEDSKYSFYLTEKELWILDQASWAASFAAAGYQSDPEDFSDRFDIAVLNKDTWPKFRKHVAHQEQSPASLKALVNQKRQANVDYLECYPSLLVNFDAKRLVSCYPEPFPYELHIPEDWQGSYGEFLYEIPVELRYWSS